jgi:hypothetical protein
MRAVLTTLVTLAGAALVVGVASCSDDNVTPPAPTELDGPSVTVGNGTAHAVVIEQDGQIRSIGVQLSDNALTGLPATMPMTEWQLSLPAGVSAGPWDHLALDWNPQGHPPPQVYTVPHFDFHFYMIPTSAQMAIAGGPDTTAVAAQFVPRDYQSEVESVPMMGVHWGDTLAAEFHGHPFDHTFIYGFHQGRMIFTEPMVTLAFLESGADFSGAVKQPAAFQTGGSYPTSYSVRHDATAHTITVSLDSLVMH